MIRYCLEVRENEAVIHKLDCQEYDLGTLLGLGCVVDLGTFASAARALESIKLSHPSAVRCEQCCPPEVMYLPQVGQPALQKGIILPSG